MVSENALLSCIGVFGGVADWNLMKSIKDLQKTANSMAQICSHFLLELPSMQNSFT